MLKRIKKNNAGSTFIIVLIAMALFIMLVSVFSMQINNQIQSSSKHYENQERKYLAESGLEKTIADISNEIEVRLNDDDYNGDNDEENKREIIINIPSYKYPNETIYKISGYERKNISIPIKVNYKNSEIVSINPSKVEFQGIRSIGYKNSKVYKVEADITFNIGKSYGEYKVISYNIDKWESYD